jgi:hypothetical protein
METPQFLRLSILLCLLAICAVWYAQGRLFDMVVVQHLTSDEKGLHIMATMQFSSKPIQEPEAEKEGKEEAVPNPKQNCKPWGGCGKFGEQLKPPTNS